MLHYVEVRSVSSDDKQGTLPADWVGIADSGPPLFACNPPLDMEHNEITSDDTTALPRSATQWKSITCDAPAVLLNSGPGTGKTYALASRIAHLITTKACGPEQMVVLSFTNRDARNLKGQALDMMFGKRASFETTGLTRDQVNDRLWSGTIHAFAASLVKAYGKSRRKFRIISSTETRMRISKCLDLLLDERRYEGNMEALVAIRRIHRDALSEMRQSRGMILHQIGRCMELWKESGILSPPLIQGFQIEKATDGLSKQVQLDQCIEVALRLGISFNVARLAWEVYPEHQAIHEHHGTADPSDVASLAYHVLLSNPTKLKAMREKLRHVLLDEYQDVSVSQHALIRLIVRGKISENDDVPSRLMASGLSAPPVLIGRKSTSAIHRADVSFHVPNIFCCGDANQSIYGWRGAAPSLSVDGFRKDYPQGIVVPLETSFRLAADLWNTAHILAGADHLDSDTAVHPKSPIGSRRQHELLRSCINLPMAETLPMIMAADSSDEGSARVNIQGVWDAREEAKYIATTIRKRSKGRVKRVAEALNSVLGFTGVNQPVTDPSDIAIITRSSNQLKAIKEALTFGGVPYVVYDSESDGQKAHPVYPSGGIMQANLMKPIALMSMHRAKGEEFDEVYLPGWSEGEFPHPTAVSSNRIDEERRLAYVAISRARNRVTITHSFVRREMHNGPNLAQKLVTTQIKPSRFLYELVPDAKKYASDVVTNSEFCNIDGINQNVPCVVWNRKLGSKEWMTGANVPSHFANSYLAPKNFAMPDQAAVNTTILMSQPRIKYSPGPSDQLTRCAGTRNDENIRSVVHGLNQVVQGIRGAKTMYKKEFRAHLKNWFDFTRGTVPTFTNEWTLEGSLVTKETLAEVITKPFTKKKALSQCSTIQLGLCLASMLFDQR